MKSEREITSVPKEGKWFEVNPLSIDQKLFVKKRKDKRQERARLLILEAFEEMSKHPEKYTKKFRTMMPKKEQKEEYITVEKLKKMACELGDHNANWVEQALEWAQRIANGESWEQLCNKCDTANWYRIVVWKSGNVRFVGGSVCYVNHSIARATSISLEEFDNYSEFQFAVPLVVSYDIATEGKWFEVSPLSIDQKLFKKVRVNVKQENTRMLILEAFEEMSKHPEKYARNFRTMMPKKRWISKTVAELKEIASELGDHNADWVEQALEWAQRIANGESWKSICNDKDTANWYRLVVWKNGYVRRVGGSSNYSNAILVLNAASDVFNIDYRDDYDDDDFYTLNFSVPLVVSYK